MAAGRCSALQTLRAARRGHTLRVRGREKVKYVPSGFCFEFARSGTGEAGGGYGHSEWLRDTCHLPAGGGERTRTRDDDAPGEAGSL